MRGENRVKGPERSIFDLLFGRLACEARPHTLLTRNDPDRPGVPFVVPGVSLDCRTRPDGNRGTD